MKLLLIWHGQCGNNVIEHQADYAQARQPDPPLTALGRQQAQHLAQALSGVSHLYTSLMTRAVQTAAPLAQALGLPAHGLAEAYEYGGLTTGPAGGFTRVTGRDHASLQEECETLVWPHDLTGRPWDGGAEAWGGFAARAGRVLDQLRAAHRDDGTLNTHHDFAGALIRAALGWPGPGKGPRFRLAHLSTSLLEVPADRSPGTVHWLNRIDHLPPELARS
ncbi:histidine phosphatase family protein [Deinococcus hohokamensis]|uniref:Histidine phosphatase family protein n=1 Tax=Deinococcus hohokamensis TaxID=309883 RepID=A0ABV9I646_9DEIO